MSRDTLILIALALILAAAGIGVFYVLGQGDEMEFVPADESLLNVEDDAAEVSRARRAKTELDPAALGTLTRPGETAGAPRAAEIAIGEEKTGIRGMVRDPSGKAVEGAVAALYEDKSDLAQMSLQGAFIGLVETGKRGRFAFDGITAGMNYLLRVEHPDYASASEGGIEVEENQVVEIVVKVATGIKVEGEVLDEGGNPVADAKIRITDQQARAIDPTEQIEREVQSGPDGRFVFPHVTAGYKRVVASKDTYATQTHASLHLMAGKEPEFLTFTLGAGVELRGKVVDQDGAPVAEAIINAEPARRRVDRASVVGNYPPIKSDEAGEFIFSGVKEGAYRLTVVKKGYGLARKVSASTAGDPVTVTLRKAPVVRGRVIDAQTGEPVKKFRLTLARQQSVIYTPSQQTQHFKSEDGTFEYVDANIKGEFYVHATGPGYAWGASTPQLGDGGQDIEGVEIRLGTGGIVKGRVVDSDGKPVAGAVVDVLPQPELGGDEGALFVEMLQKNMRRAHKRARTDSDGRYVVEQVQAGSFKVRAQHADFSTTTHERSTYFAGQGELEMPEVVLMRGATVMGVVDPKDGKPGSNCLVRLSPKGSGGFGGAVGGESYSKRSDGEGRFRFDNVKPGIYWVDVTERGGDPGNFLSDLIARKGRTEIMVADGETREVRLQ